MIRRRGNVGQQEDEEDEGALDYEYCRLRRQLRIVETERRSYADDVGKSIRKQNNEIDLLVKENEDISTGLKVVYCEHNGIRDNTNAEKLRELISTMEALNSEAESESRNIADLDVLIKKITKEIRITERENCMKSGQAMTRLLAKRTHTLANNQHEAVVKFNKQLAINARLRQELDHQRLVKGKFDNTYQKMLAKLKNMAREYNTLTKDASRAYQKRKTTKSKIQAMEQREKQEVLQHSIGIQELNRVIGHNTKLKEFLTIKYDDRADYIQEEEGKKNKGKNGIKESENEKTRIENYEAEFANLCEVTDTRDIKMITMNFMRKEEDKFALFKYINELCDEEMDIKDDILKVTQEIKELEDDDVRTEFERTVWLRELEEKGSAAGKAADASDTKIAETSKELHELRDGINSLFHVLGCDGSCLKDLLGNENGVTDRSIMRYMGIIEQTSSELLNTYHFMMMVKAELSEQRKDARGSRDVDPKRYKPIPVKRITITPPSLREEDIILESDSSTPLTIEDLRNCVNKKISEDTSLPSIKN